MFCRNKEVSWYLCGWVFSHSAAHTTTRAHTFSFLSRCRLTIINCRVWYPQGTHTDRHTHWFCKFSFHNTLWLLTCLVHVHTISRTHTDFDTPNTFFTHDSTSSTESAICCIPVNWLCGYHCDGLTGKWKKTDANTHTLKYLKCSLLMGRSLLFPLSHPASPASVLTVMELHTHILTLH